MSNKPMTDKQKELKRIRDRKYREKKRMEKMADANKKTAEIAKKIAKNIKVKNLIGKTDVKKTKAVVKQSIKLPAPKKGAAKMHVIHVGDVLFFKSFKPERILAIATDLINMALEKIGSCK